MRSGKQCRYKKKQKKTGLRPWYRDKRTMISVGPHLEVPQYIAQPWFIQCVNALTVSGM